MTKWFLLPGVFASVAGLAIAQVQPTFRVGTRLVQLDVAVLNDKTPVRGLTKDDFTLQDKGKPQTIAVFSVTEAHKAAKADPLPSECFVESDEQSWRIDRHCHCDPVRQNEHALGVTSGRAARDAGVAFVVERHG
jgi:hypothetical protein